MRLIAGVLALIALSCASAWADERRVALLIGNAQYSSATQLANPANDVRLVADAARRAGFETTVVQSNLSMQAFQRALRDFRAQADNAEVALIYYAGHGIEGGGRNWLIPTDAALMSERDLTYEAINLEQVIESIAGARFRLVIVDACRDNPFGRNWRAGTRAIHRGLAPVEVDDVMVIYAAGPGQTASDGNGVNSPFASAFARRLPEAGVPIQLLGGVVRDDVLAATGGAQRPFVSASITGTPFYLVPGNARPQAAADPAALELAVWQGALNANSLPAYEDYLRQYPQGRYVSLATENVTRLRTPRGRAIDRMVGRWDLFENGRSCIGWIYIESIEGNHVRYRTPTSETGPVNRDFTVLADNEFRVQRLGATNFRIDGDILTMVWTMPVMTCRYARRLSQ